MDHQPSSSIAKLRDGVTLRTLQWGDPVDSPGIPIVLIHGLASNARLWDGAARELTNRGHAVIAVDLRGHGLSDKQDSGYEMKNIAQDVVDVITELANRNAEWSMPLVIGQSWGGNIVVELAAHFGEHVRGVVAVDGGTIELGHTFLDWDECKTMMSPPALSGMKYDRLRSYIRAAHLDWSEEAIDGQMHNMEHLPDGTIRPWLTLERHIMVLRGLWEHFPSTLWGAIQVPVLFTPATKNNDDHTAIKRAQLSHALNSIERCKVEWFESADHDLHAQYPQRFATVVDDAITTGFFS